MAQLYHPKEAKNFLKSAARRRDWVPLPGGGARRRFPRRRAATPDRAQQDQGAVQNDQGLVEALEQQNFEPEEEDEIEEAGRSGKFLIKRQTVGCCTNWLCLYNSDATRSPLINNNFAASLMSCFNIILIFGLNQFFN